MDIKQRPLDDLTSLDRINIADKIVLSQNWPTLGLYFEKSHKFVINTAYLKAKYGVHLPDQELCRRLLDELAEKGITIGELDNALRNMSLIATANSVLGVVNAALAPANQPGSTAPEKKDITKQEVYVDLQKYRDYVANPDPSVSPPKLSKIIDYQKTLYGQDSRKDIYETSDGYQRLAESVCGLWRDTQVEIQGNQVVLKTTPFTHVPSPLHNDAIKPLADDVVFRGQPLGPFGSGFLVVVDGVQFIITAGHCVTGLDAPPIARVKFVFNYRMVSSHQLANITPDDVYTGTVVQARLDKEQDWAIVKLDREVKGRTPLTFERSPSAVTTKDKLSMIGHPYGLPLKMASDAKINKIDGHYIFAELDAFAGNSGSPVFNAQGTVVGILVKGGPDFEWSVKENAMLAFNTPITGFAGETVMKIASVPIEEALKGPDVKVNLPDKVPDALPPPLVSQLKVNERGAMARLIALRGDQTWTMVASYLNVDPAEIKLDAGEKPLPCCNQLITVLGGTRTKISELKEALETFAMADIVDKCLSQY